MENLEEIKSKVKEFALKNDIKFIVLFGSHAKGSLREDSDFDIAVLTTPEKNIRDSMDNYSSVLFGLTDALDIPDYKIDLTNLNTANPFLRQEVVLGGVLLYGDKINYAAFKSFALRDYIATSDLRNLERKMVLKRQKLIV